MIAVIEFSSGEDDIMNRETSRFRNLRQQLFRKPTLHHWVTVM